MCTVLYAPVGRSCIVASLRDESPLRTPALPPAVFQGSDTRYILPLDPAGGGSWVGVNDRGAAVVLMNGAFGRHIPAPPYRHSRGTIVRDLLDSLSPAVRWKDMPMEGVEPYSLILAHEGTLVRCTWDGHARHFQTFDPSAPHIFSSAMLYDDAARTTRQQLFDAWLLTTPAFDIRSVFGFFSRVDDRENGFLIDRGVVGTLSYSYVSLWQPATFQYHDFRSGLRHSAAF